MSVDRRRQIAVSAVDGKLVLAEGAIRVINQGEHDRATVYDLGVFPPRELATLTVPTSLAGPPQSVAVSPDQRLAVVTAAQTTDPQCATRTVPDNRVTLIAIEGDAAWVAQTVTAGHGPTGVSFSPDGRRVVVANRHDGTLSVFGVEGRTLAALATVVVGDAHCQPASTAFTPDGKTLLVSRDGDHYVSVFDVIDGTVHPTNRHLSAGLKPYGLCVAAHGRFAVVANVGRVSGDADSIGVIDLTRKPFRVVDTLGVAATPEAVAISPDGKWVVAVCHNGSTRTEDSALFHPQGSLIVFRVASDRLVRHAEHAIGRWAQGATFSLDGSVLVVQNTVERELQVFRVTDAEGPSDSGVRLPVSQGSFAAIRTVDFTSAPLAAI